MMIRFLYNLDHFIANHLPARIVYLVGIRIYSHATFDNTLPAKESAAITVSDALTKWGKDHKIWT